MPRKANAAPAAETTAPATTAKRVYRRASKAAPEPSLTTRARSMSEIGHNDSPEIEKVSGAMAKKEADFEAFMHEVVTIRLGSSGKPGELQVETPSVNGLNQPIIRGVAQPVKRKYVEVLLRAHTIEYEQETPDASKPDQKQMRARPQFLYPIDIEEDSKEGRAWCSQIRHQVQQEVARS